MTRMHLAWPVAAAVLLLTEQATAQPTVPAPVAPSTTEPSNGESPPPPTPQDRSAVPAVRRARTGSNSANYPKPQVQSIFASSSPAKGPLSKIGQSLADKGVYFRFLAVDEFAGSVSGGQGTGVGNSYALPFGADLDLDRMVGIPGAFVHVSMNTSRGSSLSADHAGNAISFQTRYKTYHNLRLAALAIEQNLFDGHVNISGGRVSPLTYFNQSAIYCTFQSNSVCFNPAVVPIQDRALGFFPYGTWGGRIKVSPSKTFYVQAGVFEANTTLNATNGFDWSTRGSTGHQTAVEIGFQSPPKAANPWHLRIGGYHNTSDVGDPYLNTERQPRIAAAGAALMHDGQAGGYVMGDVVGWHLGGDAKRPVTVFGGVIASANDYLPFKGQAIAGVIATGPFKGRPDDTLGLVGSYIRLGSRQVDYLEAARARAGGTDPVRLGEGVFELNYGIAVARGVRINPNIQYVVNPDNLPRPTAVHQSKNILAFGLRVSVDFATILGLPASK
ncbi:carbohydrate porin [Novosphingobium sp. P6W]|uniref:carbohydrate porin n=1 Tax=Novosphingobium sp. P6W TaxID=1609758 RepID=UPI000A608487|nr:carbohydrate porin [Novosphingobium sp. P6W]